MADTIIRQVAVARLVRKAKAGHLHPQVSEVAHALAAVERSLDGAPDEFTEEECPEVYRQVERLIAATGRLLGPTEESDG